VFILALIVEEDTAQKALLSCKGTLDRKLLVFPREGESPSVRVTHALFSVVEIATNYRDPVKFSSTEARAALSKGEATAGIHSSVYHEITQRKLYLRIEPSPSLTIVLILGAPAIGKGTLAKHLADLFGFSVFSAGDFFRQSMDNERYAAVTAKLKEGPAEKWGEFLTQTSLLCLAEFMALSQNDKFVLDGFESGIPKLEELIGGHCADILVHLHCSSDKLRERMKIRGRDTPEECARRLEKFESNKVVKEKQIKSLVGSPRGLLYFNIEASPPVAEYAASSGLTQAIAPIIASKPAACPTPVLTTPQLIDMVVQQAYSSPAFDALCKKCFPSS
jgi:adenylate kinase family enzyme